jgi:hypothetical protein
MADTAAKPTNSRAPVTGLSVMICWQTASNSSRGAVQDIGTGGIASATTVGTKARRHS